MENCGHKCEDDNSFCLDWPEPQDIPSFNKPQKLISTPNNGNGDHTTDELLPSVNNAASLNDLFSPSSSGSSSYNSDIYSSTDDSITTREDTHTEYLSLKHLNDMPYQSSTEESTTMPLFSPSTSFSCSYNSYSDNSLSVSCGHSSDFDADHSVIDQTSSNSSHSQCDDKSLVKNVEIEIIASDNVHINKGEKIVLICDIYSKTTCTIQQKLVMSEESKKQKGQSRTRRDCPFKGCPALNLLKLSNHLRQTHGLKNPSTIQKYLKLAKMRDKRRRNAKCFKDKYVINAPPREIPHHDTSTSLVKRKGIPNDHPSRYQISVNDSDDSSINSDITIHPARNKPLIIASEDSSSDLTVTHRNTFPTTTKSLKRNNVFNVKGFIKYLRTIAGGKKKKSVAKSIAADVVKFFNATPQSSTQRYYDVLLNIENLYNYINYLQDVKEFAPTTVAEKLRRLQMAIEYTIAKENKEENNDAMFVRCQRIMKHLEKWRHSLSKDITKQRMRHFITSEKAVQQADDPMKFCNSQCIQQKVADILDSSTISNADYDIVISFLAANLIFLNAQRPGVVQNMTIAEFMNRKTISTNKVLIKVFQHKTIAARGPANVVISQTIENLMLQYHQGIRSNIIPKPAVKDHFFLTRAGSEFRKITETIQKVAKKFKIPMPTPCLHRKVIATAGQSTLDDRDMRSLTSHMAHSAATSARFYQFPGVEPMKAASMHDTIQKLSNQIK